MTEVHLPMKPKRLAGWVLFGFVLAGIAVGGAKGLAFLFDGWDEGARSLPDTHSDPYANKEALSFFLTALFLMGLFLVLYNAFSRVLSPVDESADRWAGVLFFLASSIIYPCAVGTFTHDVDGEGTGMLSLLAIVFYYCLLWGHRRITGRGGILGGFLAGVTAGLFVGFVLCLFALMGGPFWGKF